MNNPVDDIANSEMEFRLARILSDMIILKHVAEHLQNPTLVRRVKEMRQSVGSVVVYVKRKYGVRLTTKEPTDA